MLATLKFLIATALLGLLFSTLAHVLVISGISPPSFLVISLCLVAVVVWIAVNVITFKVRFPAYDLLDWEWDWRSVFRGSPAWLHAICVLLLAYAVLAPEAGRVSAVGMFVFCLELSVLYSFHRQPWLLVGLVCPNGHKVSLVNRFCPTCGTCIPKHQASA